MFPPLYFLVGFVLLVGVVRCVCYISCVVFYSHLSCKRFLRYTQHHIEHVINESSEKSHVSFIVFCVLCNHFTPLLVPSLVVSVLFGEQSGVYAMFAVWFLSLYFKLKVCWYILIYFMLSFADLMPVNDEVYFADKGEFLPCFSYSQSRSQLDFPRYLPYKKTQSFN